MRRKLLPVFDQRQNNAAGSSSLAEQLSSAKIPRVVMLLGVLWDTAFWLLFSGPLIKSGLHICRYSELFGDAQQGDSDLLFLGFRAVQNRYQ